MAHSTKRNRTVPKKGSALLLKSVFCAWGALLASALSFLFFAWLLSRTNLPLYMAVPFSTVSVSAGAFWAGLLFTRILKVPGVFAGLSGGLVFFLFFIVASCLEGVPHYTVVTLLRFAALLSSGALGGLWGESMNRSAKKRRRVP